MGDDWREDPRGRQVALVVVRSLASSAFRLAAALLEHGEQLIQATQRMPAHSHPQLALIALPLPLSQADSSCGSGSSYNGNLDLRVGGLFLILVRRMISSFEPDPLGEEASLVTWDETKGGR